MVGEEGDDVYKMVSSNSEEILCTHVCVYVCVCGGVYIMKLGQRERQRGNDIANEAKC